MEIRIIDKKTEKTEGKKPLEKQKIDEEIIILDNERNFWRQRYTKRFYRVKKEK